MVTLEELQRSTAEVGESVHRTTISRVLHQSGLNGRVARRKPLLNVNPKKSRMEFATSQMGDTANMQNAMCGGNPTRHITLSTPSQQ